MRPSPIVGKILPRIPLRFERFQEVLLDFHGVDFVGQAFADEIFRVFNLNHPEVRIAYAHANKSVLGMIRLALKDSQSPRQKTLFNLN